MKKLVTLLIGLLIISCSKDESECLNSNSITNLVSITKNYYDNSELIYFEKMNFYNQKLMNIQYKNGSYDDYQYFNGLVNRVLKFDFNDNLFRKITYLYDNAERIIEIKNTFINQQNQNINSYIFSYNSNQILIDYPFNTRQDELILNQNNEIISDKVLKINGMVVSFPFYSYNYLNGNLKECTSTNVRSTMTSDNITYTYSDIKNNFDYRKYLFGNEWKKNVCLDNLSNQWGVKLIMEVNSENLIIKKIHKSDDNIIDIYSFNYEFNDKKQIIKETINRSSGFSISKTELIYKYE